MSRRLCETWESASETWATRRVISQHDTQAQAQQWVERNYPSHAYETERVQVRENSPRGAKRGEWRK